MARRVDRAGEYNEIVNDPIVSPWDRQPDEPVRWFRRFEKFLLLSPDRSVLATFNEWRLAKSREVSRSAPKSWRDAAAQWRWRERADAWDQYLSQQAAEKIETERIAILGRGYALRHERVRKLDELAGMLFSEVSQYELRWLEGEKSTKFNSDLIEQARKTLEDIAREMGERIIRTDITSGDKPIKGYVGISPDDWDEGENAKE